MTQPFCQVMTQCIGMNENSIEFFLSTWTWSGFKSSWLKSYTLSRLPLQVTPEMRLSSLTSILGLIIVLQTRYSTGKYTVIYLYM